jgi:hypothetical protein
MTLEENFENILHNWIDKDYDRQHVAKELGIDADKFTIKFYHWMLKNDTAENAERFFHYTDQDMLNVFKQEMGL